MNRQVQQAARNGPGVLRATLPELLARAQALAEQARVAGERRILGLTGAPGAGKSTLCTALAGALGEQAGVVWMDGFHLANAELRRLGRQQRKGAPDTFDVGGYLALLQRLRQPGETVYAPVFDRQLDESIGSAQAIPAAAPLILTEGNYLLLDQPGWQQVRAVTDEVWYLELPEDTRLERLLRRHVTYGKAPAEAEAWVAQVDQQNAALIVAARARAELIVHLGEPDPA